MVKEKIFRVEYDKYCKGIIDIMAENKSDALKMLKGSRISNAKWEDYEEDIQFRYETLKEV